jgi:hypothetical protein
MKQGEEGEYFNIVIDGFVTVVREKKDMKISKFHDMVDESLKNQKNKKSFC